jgi:hypothetical protein
MCVIAVILVTYLLLFDLFYWLWPLYMGAALLVQVRVPLQHSLCLAVTLFVGPAITSTHTIAFIEPGLTRLQGRILSCIRVSDGAFLYKDEISHFMQQVGALVLKSTPEP